MTTNARLEETQPTVPRTEIRRGLSDARPRSAGGHQPGFSLPYYLAVAAGLYLTWIVSTAIGAGLGPAMGERRSKALQLLFTQMRGRGI